MLPTEADLTLILQVALAGLLGGVLGWQRNLAGRPAGPRTHALVAMAAASFSLAGLYGFASTSPHDVTRIAAQVVTGVGFLGAGTIFRSEDHVFGLTTAATLWFAAAMGLLIAAGLTWIAILGTILALLTLFLGRLEHGPPS
jgi:putative Mg2+ transporter-C (MgtC) family protein